MLGLTIRRSVLAGLLTAAAVTILGAIPAFVGPTFATVVTCGQTLDSGTFVLESDLGPCDDATGAAALTVNGTTGTPATLDLGGFSVICQDLNGKKGVPVGILITGALVTVTNGKVVGCKVGVEAGGDGGHRVKKVTAENSTSSGFAIKSTGNKVSSSTASGGQADGFAVKSAMNKISRSTASNNLLAGFSVSSGKNKLKSNTATGNGGGGFAVGGPHTALKGNTAGGNTGDGFALTANAGAVHGNTATANTGNGFAVAATSSQNKLIGNTANGSGRAGISVSGLKNVINGNTAQTSTLVDLEDTNANCQSNKWKANTFGTKSQACIN